MQGGQLSCHQVEQTQPTAEHTQDPWTKALDRSRICASERSEWSRSIAMKL